jgi:hypothetical protein
VYETERTKRFQANIDFVASYVFAIYQRLSTRESMKAFSEYRKVKELAYLAKGYVFWYESRLL